jgi:hypothetical protein
MARCSTSMINEPKVKMRTRLTVNKEYKRQSTLNSKSEIRHETPRIRLINCAAGSNNKQEVSRSISMKKRIKSAATTDECSSRKLTTRFQTSLINDKQVNQVELCPSLEAKPMSLPSNAISKEWSTNNVLYRCHACSHEEFFLVLSRECLNLHLSSKHTNMEDNFKQRLSNFLNNQGRSIKIFQHYLKWQEPWSEKEIERLFHLSNNHVRTTHRR